MHNHWCVLRVQARLTGMFFQLCVLHLQATCRIRQLADGLCSQRMEEHIGRTIYPCVVFETEFIFILLKQETTLNHIHTMAFAAAPAVEAASELDAWNLCYQINLFFRYKQRLRVPFLCQKCGKLDRSAYRSSFVCKAVQCPQGHRPKRTVCAKCDENLVLNISRRRETCFFEKRCRFHLRVDVEAIKGIVKDAKLLDR